MILSVSYSLLAWKPLLLCLLLFEFYFLLCFGGELRFCYNGPQRILYKDCPGGFVAKKAVKTSCMYYYKAENVPNMEPYLSESICVEEANFRKLAEDNEEITNSGFQVIEFNPKVNDGPTDGSEPAYEKCNSSCLHEWIAPKHWFPANMLKDKDTLNDTMAEKFKKEYVELTKVILIKIINDDEFEENMESNDVNSDLADGPKPDFLVGNSTLLNTPLQSLMKLLAKSMRITLMRCEPFIEQSFYTLVFRTMIELRRINDNLPDMNIIPLKRIMNILDRCEKEHVPYFIINGTKCEDKHVVQTITDNASNITWVHKLQSDSFRWGRYDPIIEAAWSAVTFVHAFCFDFFSKDMLHYSLFVKGMNEIFVQPVVEKHWMYPFPVGKGMTLWEMAYDTSDIQNQMTNIDACVQGAYAGSVFDARLDRPFNKQEYIENPEYEQDLVPPGSGWNKSVDEYWKYYEKRGFKDMVTVLGYCAQSPDDLNIHSNAYAEETCFFEDQGTE